MDNDTLISALSRVRAVPVLRSPDAETAIDVGKALARGGLGVLELTFTTPDVERAISTLREDPSVIVGAGTVLSEVQARSAVQAGAQFLVSPVWLPWLPALAAELGVPAVPGAATPTEIWSARLAGAELIKVFPIARLGGAPFIRDILAPMPGLQLMATGGVTLALARDLLDAGCIAVGLGSVHNDHQLGPDIEERARTTVDTLSTGVA